MRRILLLLLITAFCKVSTAQQFYSDHGTPIPDPKVPCDCNNWHSEKRSVDSATKILKIVFYDLDGKRYKRVYYVTDINTTWYDTCDFPATCKGATRTRVTNEQKFWHIDIPDCGELKKGEVCCGNQPVAEELCCDKKVLNPGEVCCKDKKFLWRTFSVSAGKAEPWWNFVIQTSEKAKNVLKKVPAAITIDGPTFSGSYKIRDCCKDGINEVKNGETEVSAGITFGIHAKDVPCLSPPLTARIEKDITVMGYTFSLDVRYGLFATLGVDLSGQVGYKSNECIPQNCYTASFGINIPVKFEAKISIKACVKKKGGTSTQCKGITNKGVRCKKPTLNLCGYCHLHTDQSWWCIPCLDITPLAVSASTNFYGNYGFDCNEAAKIKLGVGAITLAFNISIWKFGYSVSIPVTKGAVLYP